MNSNRNLWIGLVVIGIIAICALFLPKVQKSFGAAPQNCGGTVTCFTDMAAGNVFTTVEAWLGGSTDATARQQILSSGTCSLSSSVMFTVANPFTSTSTAEIQVENVVGQATSTTFSVATSSSTGLNAQTTTGLINSGLVATSSTGTFVSGVTYGSNGANSAGTSAQGKMLVAPSDFVSGYATSTYTGAASVGYVPGVSCIYKITWIR